MGNNKKMTAVEWLVEEIEKHYIVNNAMLNPVIVMQLKRQAKAMEKEQITDAFFDGDNWGKDYFSEEYYNDTYSIKDNGK